MAIKTSKYTIDKPLVDILQRVRQETLKRGDIFLRDIKEGDPAIMVTCPFHKNHNEQKPACGVFTRPYKGFKTGDFHCFACNAAGSLSKLIGSCFYEDEEFGEEWLYQTFGGEREYADLLSPIELDKGRQKPQTLDESVLLQFDYYHPYMWERGLSKEVVDYFRIGYDHVRNAITFPVWDEKNNLKFITARSVTSKTFFIPKEAEKPLYLLNFALAKNVPVLMITEAQIDALTAWQYGFPCCATFGNISDEQINTLNKSGIRLFVTAFDNDEYGEKFTKRFNKHIRDDVLIYRLNFPPGKKDLNDLTQEEFNNCLNELNITYRIKIGD